MNLEVSATSHVADDLRDFFCTSCNQVV